jgi:hypothetical protein
MPRSKRIVIPGMPHHIVRRGNHRMNVMAGHSAILRSQQSEGNGWDVPDRYGSPILEGFLLKGSL